MKLRNKRTGEIVDDAYVRETHDFQFNGQEHVLAVFKGNGHRPPERVSGAYTSLAELNEEWEDAPEEPKEYWHINSLGEIEELKIDEKFTDAESSFIEDKHLEIGNYFETKEEAERVIEKLKAWKRLKDKGFRFDGWNWETQCIDYNLDYTDITEEQIEDAEKDLDLLFSGEDD